MKNRYLVVPVLLILFTVFLTSCSSDSSGVDPIRKVGLVSGIGGGFSDAGFNQDILRGFQQAVWDFPFFGQAIEVNSAAEVQKAIDSLISLGCSLVVTTGWDEADATVAAAEQHPGVDFFIIDCTIASPPKNVMCADFSVDQGSFQCGFLAAWWAFKQNQENPVAGFVGGPEIPSIRQFSVSYTKGIGYFNTRYGRNVGVAGYYASSFADSLQGVQLADSVFAQDASVIFAFAGATGNGTLYRALSAGKQAIGVDVDQYRSIPAVGSILLTSCMKGLGTVVYSMMKDYSNKVFKGGTTVHGTLSNSGVAIAPFHDYENVVPDSVKTALAAIKTGIINGTIPTGWPE